MLFEMILFIEAQQPMTSEQITDKFNLAMDCCPPGVDLRSYVEGVYQALLCFSSVDTSFLSTLNFLKIDVQIITDPF